MSLIIDGLLIVAAAACLYLGITRGFIRSVMGFASILIAIGITFLFTGPVSVWVEERFVGDWVSSIVDDAIAGIAGAGTDSGSGGENQALSSLIEDRPAALETLGERFGFSFDEIEQAYTSLLDGSHSEGMREALAAQIASPTASAISHVLAAIGLFLVSLLILKIAVFVLDLIFRLPLLKTLNTLLGLLFGAASAALSGWVICNMAVGLIRALEAVKPEYFNEAVITGSVILKYVHAQGWLLIQ